MKTIVKKCQPPYFEQVLNGTKRFEIRLNDVDYQVGDMLELWEYLNEYTDYTGRVVACRITSLVNLFIRDYPLNDNVGLNSAGPPTVMIDGKEFWSGEDILQYGLVVIGISIIGEK